MEAPVRAAIWYPIASLAPLLPITPQTVPITGRCSISGQRSLTRTESIGCMTPSTRPTISVSAVRVARGQGKQTSDPMPLASVLRTHVVVPGGSSGAVILHSTLTLPQAAERPMALIKTCSGL